MMLDDFASGYADFICLYLSICHFWWI